ncbi:histone H2A-like 3 [Hylobates moloch]|uniref:histone H2A-like 3 n=1 Tax=Hylobates moloch TaxID=81572 RepID=UPI0026754BC4|nr:histone H2A-like 3 [Hylobates moloch]
MAGNKHSRSSCKPRRQRLSRSRRVELQFHVSHMVRCLQEGQHAQHLSSTTSDFLAAVLQYPTANILEQAGKEAQNSHRVWITPEDLKRGLSKNQGLRWILEEEDDTHSQEEEMPQPEEEEEEEDDIHSQEEEMPQPEEEEEDERMEEEEDDLDSQEEEMPQSEEEEEDERMEKEEEEKKEEEKEEEKKKGGFLGFRAVRDFISNLLQMPKFP